MLAVVADDALEQTVDKTNKTDAGEQKNADTKVTKLKINETKQSYYEENAG